ncbi:MAG: fatty acid desaturase [Vicinamibacterales bacterium]
MGHHHYSAHAGALRAELGRAVPRDLMRELHTKSVARHLLVAGRQFAILAVCTWALIRFTHPAIWIPLVIVQGFTVFNFSVLLHEVVHHAVFTTRRPVLERVLGLLYATPSGLSASQFTRWHLDHHAELGSEEDDPKRHHLSPKINARWYKLLYATPVLFPIYFRAAKREATTYEPELRQRIGRERWLSIGFHLGAMAAIWTAFGASAALRAHILPVFFVFPVAFTLNRLGQHYDINPDDPAQWGTLMRGHWFWDFLFLNSNYHLEHHYFPGVPFYRLPKVQTALRPFYAERGMTWMTYGKLVYGWIVENQAPHTNWHAADARPRPASPRIELS